MESSMVKSYLKRKLSGKTRVAAILDAVGIRLFMGFALYVWFLYLTKIPLLAFILALCVAGCLSIALSMHKKIRYGMKLKKLRSGIRRRCSLEKLALLPEDKAMALLRSALSASGAEIKAKTGQGYTARRGGVRIYGEILLTHPEMPLTPQDIASAWKRAVRARASMCILYSSSAAGDQAKAAAARLKSPGVELPGQEKLLKAGKRFGVLAGDEQVDAAIRAEAVIENRARAKRQRDALSKVRAARYMLCAATIAAAWLIFGRQTYYLIAAGACVALAAVSLLRGMYGGARKEGA
jgi:hypothetical protein